MKALSFIALAREDMKVADLALGEGILRQAEYHLAQLVEKLVKGVLETEETPYPATSHQLDDLVRRLPADHLWYGDLQPFARYGAASTTMRYPTASGDLPKEPPADRVRADLEAVRAIIDEIEDWCRERQRNR